MRSLVYIAVLVVIAFGVLAVLQSAGLSLDRIEGLIDVVWAVLVVLWVNSLQRQVDVLEDELENKQ